jgi:hypothetical protein
MQVNRLHQPHLAKQAARCHRRQQLPGIHLLQHARQCPAHAGMVAEGRAQPGVDAHQLHVAMEHMAGAITAMQFQDMASQLVDHTTRRLRHCADRLARDAFAGDEDEGEGDAIVERAPLRPNPVTQDEMDAGSVELF